MRTHAGAGSEWDPRTRMGATVTVNLSSRSASVQNPACSARPWLPKQVAMLAASILCLCSRRQPVLLLLLRGLHAQLQGPWGVPGVRGAKRGSRGVPPNRCPGPGAWCPYGAEGRPVGLDGRGCRFQQGLPTTTFFSKLSLGASPVAQLLRPPLPDSGPPLQPTLAGLPGFNTWIFAHLLHEHRFKSQLPHVAPSSLLMFLEKQQRMGKGLGDPEAPWLLALHWSSSGCGSPLSWVTQLIQINT